MESRRYVRSIKLPSWTKRFFGLEPMPLPPAVFSVDETQLRFARFERQSFGYELADYQAVDLDPDLFAAGPVGGPIHDPERFRSAVAELQEGMEGEVQEGSLILPDPWLRIALVESEDLPRKGEAREEVLKWKLQRTVPFRVEELRVRGTMTSPRNRFGNGRVLLGFGLEGLLRQLEGVFEDRGIHLGYISSESLTLLSAVRDVLSGVELGAVAFVSTRGYSLTFVLHGEPVLHRFKALPQMAGDEPPQQLVERDLKLTKMYLGEQFPGGEIGRLLLIGPREIEERWLGWLAGGFGLAAHPLRLENLPLSTAGTEVPLCEVATLLGAARQEVA